MSDLETLRRQLEGELLAWMEESSSPSGWKPDEARFDGLARRLFAFQFARCTPYRRLCEARGVSPEKLESWRQIPAVPSGAFKEFALRCFPAEADCKVFRTSGSSGERRGELHLDTLALYEASLLAALEHPLLPELEPGERTRILVLAAAPEAAPDSSLSHMFGVLRQRRGDAQSGFFLDEAGLELARLLPALEKACADGVPLTLCGTSFAFVHLLEALTERGLCLRLPPGSRVMETGGFKGRSRSLSRLELHGAIESGLGVPETRCVNQYGMTELGSQFYDSVLREPDAPRRKLEPPWARVRILDPETGREQAPGEVGSIAVHDLANTGSVAAILTADLGRRVEDGFEVLGREPGAEARGCSLAADLMLEAGER